MRSFLLQCRGQANRFYTYPFGYTQRGSFSAPELFTNNSFASGTTGWTANSTTLTAADGIARLTVPTPALQSISQSLTMVQYAPYALRSILHDGRGSSGLAIGRLINAGGTGTLSDYAAARGLGTLVRVNLNSGAGANYACVISPTSGYIAGDFVECSYASLARCALVDNGPNFTQQSDTIDNAYWTKNASSVSANATAAPDGTTTADTLIENGAAAAHYITRTETRTSQVEDWCAFGRFKRASGTRNIRLVVGRDASNYVHAIFDLGAGTIAQAAAAVGDATNARAVIASLGNGWYYCAIVGRLTATTGLQVYYELANGTSLGYAGDTTSGAYCWRVGAAQSGVPTRGMQTTSAGDSDGVVQTGSALHLKGLPVSTDGLLLADDLAEIITPSGSQLVRARASLNADAAGLGWFQFEPPLRESPADNAAVIVRTPLMLSMLAERSVKWNKRHFGFTDLEFTAVEDIPV